MRIQLVTLDQRVVMRTILVMTVVNSYNTLMIKNKTSSNQKCTEEYVPKCNAM